MMMTSQGRSRAFARARGLEPGIYSAERRGRSGAGIGTLQVSATSHPSRGGRRPEAPEAPEASRCHLTGLARPGRPAIVAAMRSEEHTSELQSLMRNSYAVFCLKKKKHT